MAKIFSDSIFETEMHDKSGVVLIDLWAEWCGPCKAMNPVIEELASEYAGKAVIAKLNVDDNPDVPTKFNVRGIPTFLLFKNGELQDKIVGATSKKILQEKINACL